MAAVKRTALCLLAILLVVAGRSALATPHVEPTDAVKAVLERSRAAKKTGGPAAALPILQEARELARKLKDVSGEALAVSGIGSSHEETGDLGRALSCKQEARGLYRSIGHSSAEGYLLMQAAMIRWRMGEPSAAIEMHLEALKLERLAGSLPGEENCLSNLGILYADTMQFDRALHALAERRRIAASRGDTGDLPNDLATLGIVYRTVGQYDQAIDCFERARRAFAAANIKPYEANMLAELGRANEQAGDAQAARRFYQDAMRLYAAIGDDGGAAGVQMDLGDLLLASGDPNGAVAQLSRALSTSQSMKDARRQANVLGSLAMARADLGMHREAVRLFDAALQLAAPRSDPEFAAGALTERADVRLRLNDRAGAERDLRSAIVLVERMRGPLGAMPEMQGSTMETRLWTYHGLVSLLIGSGRKREAFELSERTKARSLVDRTAGGRIDWARWATDDERKREAELRARLDACNRRAVAGGVGRSRAAAAKQELAAADRAYRSHMDLLVSRHPSLSRRAAARMPTLREAAGSLPANTAILSYTAIERSRGKASGIALFALTASGGSPTVSCWRLPITGAELAERIADLHAACADPRSQYAVKAKDLYRLIVGPAESAIRGKQRIIVCPDGPLWNLPFEVLANSAGRLLADRFEVAYAYHALSRVGGAPGQRRSFAAMAANVVVVADPAFAPAQPDQGVPGSGSRPIYVDARSALVPRGGGLAPLPGARKEAEAIRRYCPGATVLYGAEAQESALRLRLSTAGLIHLATHGVANDAAPMMSGVALAAPANSADDGVLTAREIMEMDLRADLVVLSACDTGRGTPRAGEGLLGLAWALSAAGARSQVLARWAVSDNSTAVLMDRFYSGLAGGKTRAAALRSAAASLRRDGTHGHPYYWAPFFLLGEWGH